MLPSTLVGEFEKIAKPNTDLPPYGIETCGILAGKLVSRRRRFAMPATFIHFRSEFFFARRSFSQLDAPFPSCLQALSSCGHMSSYNVGSTSHKKLEGLPKVG